MDEKITAANSKYKWIALSNTTLGVLMATINQSILIIALPIIFNGLKVNPLAGGRLAFYYGFCLVLALR